MTRIRLLALATRAAVVAIGAPTALGHTRVIDSDVTLGLSSVNGGQDAAWHGHVISPRAKCGNNRRVRVYHQVNGPDELIGQDVTGSNPGTANNEYVVYDEVYPPDPGSYYARVLRKVLYRSARHRHVCAAARSELYPVTF